MFNLVPSFYQKLKLKMVQIKLKNSPLCAIVDNADVDLVSEHKWRLAKHRNAAYACATINGKPKTTEIAVPTKTIELASRAYQKRFRGKGGMPE